jgi:hypothetical protein
MKSKIKAKTIIIFISVIMILSLVASIIHVSYWKNRAREDGEYFIDINGNIVSKAFVDTGSFVDGIAICYDKESTLESDEICYINTDMQVIGYRKFLEHRILRSSYNGEAYFTALEGNSIQILNKDMNTITDIPYNTEGIEYVSEIAREIGDNGLFPIKDYESGLWGYMDINGNMVIEPKYKDAERFINGRAVVGKYGEKGVIDSEGNYKIEPIFDDISLLKNGIAFAVREESDECGLFIDVDGNILPGEGTFAKDFREFLYDEFDNDFFPVKDSATNLIGFVDENIDYKIAPKYYDARNFTHGMAPVKDEYGRWGYVDTTGKEVIPCQFTFAAQFGENDLACVQLEDGNHCLIKKDGSYYTKPGDYVIDNFQCGYALVSLGKGQKVELCK